jgi:DNA primase
MNLETITIKEYLIKKGIKFIERNKELISKCLFNDCDSKSRPNEAHLYFSEETGQYDCKKCGEKGNVVTLAKHLGDSVEDVALNPKKARSPKIGVIAVSKCHNALPDRIRAYLNARGLTDKLISEYELGWGQFYGKWWITIPIKNEEGEYAFFKLRQDPEDTSNPDRYKFSAGSGGAALFGWNRLEKNKESIVICEGEFDCMLLSANGIPAITSTAGAKTFKDEWIPKLKKLKKVYVCFDKDKTGEEASDGLISRLNEALPQTAIYKISFPDRMKDGKDITDYFIKWDGTADELFKHSKQIAGKWPVDTSKLKPITAEELISVLGLTIKRDEENKLIAFLCCLSAYTDQSQFNISFNAPSSTGKSFIPIEISSLFPEVDVTKLGNCSPTAFFHDQGEYDKETNVITVDLSRKIIIFLDQPHTALLERLRSLLSHDQKEMISKITDKNQKGGNRTKTVILKGYPSVIFCSAGLKIDEQESTRFILLSPETSQEKFRFAIHEKVKKESNYDAYLEEINSNPERKLLMERIEGIKQEEIGNIRISDPELIEKIFLANRNKLKPRHQRDVGRLLALTKIFALLNVWFRERDGNTIIANEDDIKEAAKLWDKISESQEYNLPPYVYKLYRQLIVPAYEEKNYLVKQDEKMGLTRQEIREKHYSLFGNYVPDWQLRQNILPMLETAGLVIQEQDLDDRRKTLVTPADFEKEGNSEQDCGVKF